MVRTISIRTWLIDRLGGSQEVEVDSASFFEYATEYYIRNLAFQSAKNLIANSVSKCEFKTYLNNVEMKGAEYYLFNYEPNKNQTSTAFMHKLIDKLYDDNECLVIQQNSQLLIADSFFKKEYALFDYTFSGVTVNDFTFNKTFSMSEVMYFRLNNKDIRSLINGIYESYGKMITYAQKCFLKSRGNRGILDISTMAQGKPDFKETFSKIVNEYFKTYFEADSAVLPLFEGYKYTAEQSKTYSNEGTRDIKAMIDDIYDFTARALGIPPVVLKGDLANNSDAVNNYLTFCIDPLTDALSEEINRKRNGYSGFEKGNYIKIDTKCIKHIDLLSVATSIDKLVSSGCFCINDIRKVVGDEIIDEPWAWEHFITKNYASVEDFLNSIINENATKT